MKKEMRSARWLGVALTLGLLPPAVAAEVHQATGFKVVNVTSAAADIWTRVTLRSAANPADAPLPRVEAFEVKTGKPVALRENRVFPDTRITVHMPPGLDLGAAGGGAPAATGQTRVRFRVKGAAAWSETPWQSAGMERDGIVVHSLAALVPATHYDLVVQARWDAGPTPTGDVLRHDLPEIRATGPSRTGATRMTTTPTPASRWRPALAVCLGGSRDLSQRVEHRPVDRGPRRWLEGKNTATRAPLPAHRSGRVLLRGRHAHRHRSKP